MTSALVFVLILNLTNLILPALASAALEMEIAPLIVSPTTPTAGEALSVAGAGFAPGEALLALIVTPNRQTLNLGAADDGQTVAITDAPDASLVADADGAVAFALLTAENYQTGGWALVVRGQESGLESWGQFTLVATEPEPMVYITSTPVPTRTPTPPAPTVAPQPSTTPVPTAEPAAAPSTAPAEAPTASVAPPSPAASGTPAAPTQGTPAPSASGTPVTSAAPSASPVPAATPGASATPEPSVAASPSASAAPSASPVGTPEPSATPVPSAPASSTQEPTVPSPPAPTSPLTPGGYAVVTSPTGNASVHAEPSTGAAVIKVINNGTLVAVTGPSQEAGGFVWWPVAGDGFAGWVVANLLAPAVAMPSTTPTPSATPSAPTEIGPGARVVVESAGGGANLRDQPSAGAAIVQIVPNGTILTVTGPSQEADGYTWWPVQGEGVQGWIVSGLIRLAPTASADPGASPSPGASPAASTAPTEDNPGVPPPPIDAPALAPSQLLPIFQQAAQLHGIPVEILLAIGRVESGFSPRAVGPLIPRFAGTEDQHALGMMQFLPSTYRGVMARVDAATGRNLGINGIWDAESAIHAAAIYLKDGGAPGNMRRALFAYNNAEWYVDLILAWAAHYAGGTIPDPNMFDPTSNGAPPSLNVPQNPLIPNNTRHIDMLSPIQLYAPWTAGQTWSAGGAGSFYGDGYHVDGGGLYYAVDFNKGVWPNLEEDDGELILAAADGIVNNIYQDAAGAWVVELYHVAPDGSQLRTLYVHLKMDPRINPGIQPNQVVYHGTPIGLNGTTGNSTGPHLHFGLFLLRDGQWMSIRPEPMEGQYLFNGTAITSTNQLSANAAAPRTLQSGFAPNGPSNADRVAIAALAQGGAGPLERIEVYVNTASDGSDRGQWLPVGTIQGDSGQVNWQAAPIADGTYRVLYVLIDPQGNRTYHGLTGETAVRYTIRRGEPRGSAVLNPRADLALLAPLDGAALARIGAQHPIISGPLRFAPASGQPPRLASIGLGAAIVGQTAQAGSGPTGKVRAGLGLFVEEATTNLVTNPSFEHTTDGWTIRNLPGGALVATVVESGPFGARSVRLDNRAGTRDAAFVTVAGDGNVATWSVYARAASDQGITPTQPTSVGLQMAGLDARTFELTPAWQRFALTGETGGTGNERLIVVPAGAVIEIDAAQLEIKPYATSYADGSLGSGYGWDRVEHNSLSGRMPTSLQVNLNGIVSADRGAIGFWATPLGAAADGAHLLALGEQLTLSVAGEALTLRWGDQVIGAMPWVQGETHHYAVLWENGILAFFQDGKLVAETFLADFALPGESVAFIGTDLSGTKAANVAIQDLVVWSRLPSRASLAAVNASGEFLRAGIPQAQTLDVTIALASQGLAPAALKMQFSFDGQTWTAPEPFAATKTILLPDTPGNVQVYVRFTDEEGKTIVLVDRIQVVARPEQLGEE